MTLLPPLTGTDSTQKLQQMLTGVRTAPPALGTAPLEATVVSATATEVIVEITGFATPGTTPTHTCKYETIYAWNGAANVAHIPPAGTLCLVVQASNDPASVPWVIGFYGLSAP